MAGIEQGDGMSSRFLTVAGGIAVVVIAFFVTLYALDFFSGPVQVSSTSPQSSTPAPQAGPGITKASAVGELPKLPTPGFSWIQITGLNAQVVQQAPAVAGTPTLQLIAVPVAGKHFVAALIGGLAQNRTYRMALWVKSEAGGNFQIEAGDHASTGASYANGLFDLAHGKTGGSGKPGISSGPGGWQKVWVDLPTSTGQLFFALYVLKGGNDYMGDGKVGITLGGVEMEPQG